MYVYKCQRAGHVRHAARQCREAREPGDCRAGRREQEQEQEQGAGEQEGGGTTTTTTTQHQRQQQQRAEDAQMDVQRRQGHEKGKLTRVYI
jgi:hypothetical protein